jgi:hypothetical protein
MSQISATVAGNRPIGPVRVEGRIFEHGAGHRTASVGTAESLTIASARFQKITATGSYTMTLPPEEDSDGLAFCIASTGSGAFVITIEDDAASAVVTGGLSNDEQVWVSCDGTTWESMGIASVSFT